MDLSYTEEYEQFRTTVRAFLATEWQTPSDDPTTRKTAEASFRQRAIKAGLLYRHVPIEYGGSGQAADVLRGQIIREEFETARAPGELTGPGPQWLVPTLLEHGTAEQKDRFVRATLAGKIRWAQGYSEPGAGSDLASVRTRGVLDGAEWVIDGQKVWSTHAQFAHWMFALVRTEPEAPKHQGLTYVLIDMKQPGVTVRPLKQMNGASEFCEVFLDGARTPVSMIVGARGEGWAISKSTLKHERSTMGGATRSAKLFDSLVRLARTTELAGTPAIDRPDIRQRLAAIAGQMASLTYSSYRQTSMAARGQLPGIIDLLFKLYSTNIGHDIARLSRDIIGDSFLLAPPAEGAKSRGPERWNNHYMTSLAVAIAGGTSNIQRNVIAERGLNLPRDGEAGGATL